MQNISYSYCYSYSYGIVPSLGLPILGRARRLRGGSPGARRERREDREREVGDTSARGRSRSPKPARGKETRWADRSDDDERDRSRRFFFERLSSLFDRLRLRLFARVTVMNFLFT